MRGLLLLLGVSTFLGCSKDIPDPSIVLSNKSDSILFEKLTQAHGEIQYAYLEMDKTYSLAIFHKYARVPPAPKAYEMIDNFIFKPADYLPTSNNMFTLTRGDLELVVSIYE
ncbi:MAG: hypothetical protein ACRBFS_06170 [Aureispira sp.]